MFEFTEFYLIVFFLWLSIISAMRLLPFPGDFSVYKLLSKSSFLSYILKIFSQNLSMCKLYLLIFLSFFSCCILDLPLGYSCARWKCFLLLSSSSFLISVFQSQLIFTILMFLALFLSSAICSYSLLYTSNSLFRNSLIFFFTSAFCSFMSLIIILFFHSRFLLL